MPNLGRKQSRHKNSYASYSDLLKYVSHLIKAGLPQSLPYFDLGPMIHELLSEFFVWLVHANGFGAAKERSGAAVSDEAPARLLPVWPRQFGSLGA
jgi:hypothetical protein